MDAFFGLLLVFFLLFIYFIPAVVASNRNHNNTTAILILNLFLGWTFIGWVIALVWANTSNVAIKQAQNPNNKTIQETSQEINSAMVNRMY